MRDFLLKLVVCVALIGSVVALGSALPKSAAAPGTLQIASFD